MRGRTFLKELRTLVMYLGPGARMGDALTRDTDNPYEELLWQMIEQPEAFGYGDTNLNTSVTSDYVNFVQQDLRNALLKEGNTDVDLEHATQLAMENPLTGTSPGPTELSPNADVGNGSDGGDVGNGGDGGELGESIRELAQSHGILEQILPFIF